jgi:AraC-like DNA-binding protein
MDSESRTHRQDAQAPHAQDYWRVNLAEPWEITFWTREFGCSEAQLKEAVQAVGQSAGAVRRHLR